MLRDNEEAIKVAMKHDLGRPALETELCVLTLPLFFPTRAPLLLSPRKSGKLSRVGIYARVRVRERCDVPGATRVEARGGSGGYECMERDGKLRARIR